MASPPANDRAFLREVDEELLRDRMVSVWERWGRWLVAAVVAALVALGGGLWWWQHQADRAGEQGEQLADAQKDIAANQTDAAQKLLTGLAQSSQPGYRALAKYDEAVILLRKNDAKGAAAKFAEVANDATLAQPFRDLALIRQTAIEYDSLPPQTVIDRLQGFANKDSPWLGSAGEMVAIAWLRQGKRDAAGKLFGLIGQTDGVPQTIRQRAVQMAGILGVDAAKVDKGDGVTQSEESK